MGLRKLLCLPGLMLCAHAHGQCVSASAQVGGLVTNQAITPAGQDFFQAFTALWQDNALHERYSIAIREWPTAKTGNAIQVDYGNRTVFRAVLPAGRGAARELGADAVELAFDNIAAAQAECLLFGGGDLAAEEF